MAATLGSRAKDPAEVVDYTVDWTSVLGAATISTSAFAADAGLTVDSSSNGSTSATVVLSGGVAGKSYVVRNTITTSTSRTRRRSFLIIVHEQ